MAKSTWTDESLEYCLHCLSQSETVAEALSKFRRMFPDVAASSRTVQKVFGENDLESPQYYLGSKTTDFDDYAENLKEQRKKDLYEKHERRNLELLRKRQTVIDTLVDALREETAVLPRPTKPKPCKKKPNTGGKEDIVAPVSDVQIGEFVDAEAVGGTGEYSFEIFEKRLKVWKEFLITLIKRRMEQHNVGDIYIPFIGDIVEGVEIYASQPHHIEMGLVRQTVKGAYAFANALAEIAATFPDNKIISHHVGGNHGRIGRKGANPYEDNWDRLLGYIMSLHLKDTPNVEMHIPKAWFSLVNVKGWMFHFSHGDNINSWMSIPAYGMLRAHSREQTMLGSIIHYYIIGHHHVLSQMQNGYGEVICNGNWVGGNEFSAKEIKSATRPCQLIMMVNEQHGVSDRSVCYFESKDTFVSRQQEFLKKKGIAIE